MRARRSPTRASALVAAPDVRGHRAEALPSAARPAAFVSFCDRCSFRLSCRRGMHRPREICARERQAEGGRTGFPRKWRLRGLASRGLQAQGPSARLLPAPFLGCDLGQGLGLRFPSVGGGSESKVAGAQEVCLNQQQGPALVSQIFCSLGSFSCIFLARVLFVPHLNKLRLGPF